MLKLHGRHCKMGNRLKEKRSLSIRIKLSLLIVSLIVLSVSVIELYSYFSRAADIETAVRKEQLNTAILTASRLETEIARTVSVLQTAACNEAFISEDKNTIIKALKNIKDQNEIFSTVFLVDSMLNKLNEKSETGSLATREYMQEVKKIQKTVISHEILISQSTKKPSIMIATPIKINGAPESYLGISVNTDYLQRIVNEVKSSESEYTFAFDGKNGLVFAHPDAEYIGKLKVLNPDEPDKKLIAPQLREAVELATNGNSGSTVYTFNGEKIIAAYANIPGTNLGVVTRMTHQNAMAPIRRERNISLLITFIASLLGFALAYFLSKFISDPIKKVSNMSKIISKGDFSKTSDIVKSKNNDEISCLQESFGVMADMLKTTMHQIHDATIQIASASGELQISSEKSAQASEQVAVAVSEVSQGAVNQAEAADKTLQAVKKMSERVKDIAIHACSAENVSKSSSLAVESGEKAINHAVQSITAISSIVQSTAETIRRLAAFSDKISEIVDSISEIAFQTNLLALNAAIEAARAGEHGKGFAVVAQEVKKLAEQSKESASSISEILGQIQNQIHDAVSSIDKSTEEVSSGQKVVLVAGESFFSIEKQIAELSEAVDGITESINSLYDYNSNVLDAVGKIRDISQETASNSKTISMATEEQSAGVEEIASSAESLAQLSSKLELMLKKYKF